MLIVYIDETMFTKTTYHTYNYMTSNTATLVDARDVYVPYVCVIAAVSADVGVQHYRSYNTPVNSEIFASFVEELSTKLNGRPFCLFMDRASFHSSPCVKQMMTARNVTPIMNVAWNPAYNPIEGCFAIVKNYYKRCRLNDMTNGKPTVV